LSFMVPRFRESYHPRVRVKTAAQVRITARMECDLTISHCIRGGLWNAAPLIQ
jgi:hypothetical protein